MMAAKVLIGIPLGSGVAAEFFRSFLPAINLLPEEGSIHLQYVKWGNAVSSRNKIAEDFLEKDFSHLFFMDSDMEFPENTLARLLQADRDIVGGLYTVKIPPHNTTIFRRNGNGVGNYTPGAGEGVVEVDCVATGCMLVKREVFAALTWPYFWYKEDPPGSKQIMTEDSYFCLKAQEAGFDVCCDTSILCGHIGTAMIKPRYDGDGTLKGSLEMV